MCVCVCAEPLSTYPSYKQLSQLKVDLWVRLAIHYGLRKDQIETIRSSGNPTAETFIAAKKENVDFNWRDVLEGLLAIGEYELAERVCTEQGWSLALTPGQFFPNRTLGKKSSSGIDCMRK